MSEIIAGRNAVLEALKSGREIEKINMPDNFDTTMEYTVKRRDIDLNFHMHNLYYLDLAYEVLPEEVYEQWCNHKLR